MDPEMLKYHIFKIFTVYIYLKHFKNLTSNRIEPIGNDNFDTWKLQIEAIY